MQATWKQTERKDCSLTIPRTTATNFGQTGIPTPRSELRVCPYRIRVRHVPDEIGSVCGITSKVNKAITFLIWCLDRRP